MTIPLYVLKKKGCLCSYCARGNYDIREFNSLEEPEKCNCFGQSFRRDCAECQQNIDRLGSLISCDDYIDKRSVPHPPSELGYEED